MGFLRRLLGGRDETGEGDAPAAENAVSPDEVERAHELEMARFEQERTDDLVRRQQRYADRAWTPPRQGGERRAEDDDPATG